MCKDPREKSLDKTRGKQKTVTIVGAIEAVFGFLLCQDSSGSWVMPVGFEETIEWTSQNDLL